MAQAVAGIAAKAKPMEAMETARMESLPVSPA
jgi:hypothetical protein